MSANKRMQEISIVSVIELPNLKDYVRLCNASQMRRKVGGNKWLSNPSIQSIGVGEGQAGWRPLDQLFGVKPHPQFISGRKNNSYAYAEVSELEIRPAYLQRF